MLTPITAIVPENSFSAHSSVNATQIEIIPYPKYIGLLIENLKFAKCEIKVSS